MPAEYQQKLVNTIEGLEEARVVQPGMSTPATNTMYINQRYSVYYYYIHTKVPFSASMHFSFILGLLAFIDILLTSSRILLFIL